MTRITALRGALFAAVLISAASALPSAARELMLIGDDEKITWDDAGKPVFMAPGKDQVLVVDIGTDPLAPKIIANLPLMNTIFGPPTNLQITPDGKLALVANSMDYVADGASWKAVPDNKLYVIDLTANPPRLIDTVTVGKQPSGLSINRAGDLALIANRADNSISVLKISGQSVKLIDTVVIGEMVAHVAITPDGKRAVAAKFPGHKVALLDIDGDKVTYNKQDLPVGQWPYNLDITPDGKLALTADNGAAGAADGNVDTVSVIDLEAKPPRVIDKVVVGDGPEGFAISPTGKLAVAVLLRGQQCRQEGVLLQPQRDRRRAQDRRQEGDEDQRGRGSRPARRRGLQRRRQVSLRRELPRQRHLDPARRRRPAGRHRQAPGAARTPGVDARTRAVAAERVAHVRSAPPGIRDAGAPPGARVRRSRAVWAPALALALAACGPAAERPLQGYIEGEYLRVAAPFAGTLQQLAVRRGAQVAAGAPLFALGTRERDRGAPRSRGKTARRRGAPRQPAQRQAGAGSRDRRRAAAAGAGRARAVGRQSQAPAAALCQRLHQRCGDRRRAHAAEARRGAREGARGSRRDHPDARAQRRDPRRRGRRPRGARSAGAKRVAARAAR